MLKRQSNPLEKIVGHSFTYATVLSQTITDRNAPNNRKPLRKEGSISYWLRTQIFGARPYDFKTGGVLFCFLREGSPLCFTFIFYNPQVSALHGA